MPLRIGGNYRTLARFNQYAARTFSAATVLARTGLAKLATGTLDFGVPRAQWSWISLVARH